MKHEIFHIFFPASSPGEHIEMTPMIPNTTNQDHDAVKSMDNIVADSDDKNLTVKISEPLVKSETASDNEDNCATNTCPETIQEVSEKIVTEGISDIEKKTSVSHQTNNDSDNAGEL